MNIYTQTLVKHIFKNKIHPFIRLTNNKVNSYILFALLSQLLLLMSCAKLEPPSWDMQLSTPLINTTIDLSDIIPEQHLSTGDNNLVIIDFSQEVYSLPSDDLFNLDQLITELTYTIPLTVVIQPGQTFISSLEETKFQFDEAEISRILIDKGIVTLHLINPFKEVVVCNYSIPGSWKNGKIFSSKVKVPPATNVAPGIAELDVDISGYRINLKGPNNTSANTILVNIEAALYSNANALQITPFDTLKIEAKFKELKLAEAHGYFGQHEISNEAETISLKSFDIFKDGNINIDSVAAKIKISNGAGIDLQLMISELSAINSASGNRVHLNDPFMNVPVNINRASFDLNAGSIVPVQHTFKFDPNTTKKMIELLPDKLEYSMDISVNPLGNISFGNDFFYINSPVNAWFELHLPLNLSLEKLQFNQEVDFNFNIETVKSGSLYLIVDNTFNFDATISLKMKDKTGELIDSILPAGIVAAGYNVLPEKNEPVRTVIEIQCDEKRVDLLRQTEKIVVEVALDTKPDGTMVKIRSIDYMDITVSGSFNSKILK